MISVSGRNGAAVGREVVVLVHGLYMHGLWMSLLGRRLRQAGYRTIAFSYPSLRNVPTENARALEELVESLDEPVVHFLAHSLGGLVIRHLFAQSPQRPGRVVTLACPHQGSYAARYLCERGRGRILGRSIEQGLLGDVPPWPVGRELGSLAGTLNLGWGRLMPEMPGPADGIVAVAETYLSGMTDHLCLPVNHVGMLVAPSVAMQVCAFFATGRFEHCP